MHIVIALLGVIVSLLVVLKQLAEAGISLGGLNPFLWRRRRKWKKQYEGNPIYKIESPLDLSALLATATAKADGDLSSEEKQNLLGLFQSEFNVDKRAAAELLISSSYLLGKGDELKSNLDKVMQPALGSYTDVQASSTAKILDGICADDSTGLKSEFATKVKVKLTAQFEDPGAWG